MSFAVDFIRKRPEESWEEVLEAYEFVEVESPSRGALSDAARARLDALAERIESSWPGFSRRLRDDGVELSERGSGLEICLFEDTAWMTVPYWHDAEAAERVLEAMRSAARTIEEETGWKAWDPQAGGPFLQDPAGPSREYAVGRAHVRAFERPRPWWKFW